MIGGTGTLRVAFAGTFATRLEERVRTRLRVPCDVAVDGEAAIVPLLPDVDVLVTLAFTREMGTAARRLKLLQVPGAGLDRIDRSALPAGTWLANVHGHEVGIAEYVIGAMLAVSRNFLRLDARLQRGEWESQWAAGSTPPPGPELSGKTVGILGYGRIGQAVARRARRSTWPSGPSGATRPRSPPSRLISSAGLALWTRSSGGPTTW